MIVGATATVIIMVYILVPPRETAMGSSFIINGFERQGQLPFLKYSKTLMFRSLPNFFPSITSIDCWIESNNCNKKTSFINQMSNLSIYARSGIHCGHVVTVPTTSDYLVLSTGALIHSFLAIKHITPRICEIDFQTLADVRTTKMWKGKWTLIVVVGTGQLFICLVFYKSRTLDLFLHSFSALLALHCSRCTARSALLVLHCSVHTPRFTSSFLALVSCKRYSRLWMQLQTKLEREYE